MKKIIVSLTAFLFIICCTNTVQSQTVTVGSTISYNTGTQIPTAYSRQYASTHQQILVLASELISAGAPVGGNITSIAFDVVAINNSSPLPGYTIKMKQTSSTWISTFSNTGLTQVKTYASYSVSTGWNTHTFSTSFQWDGFSNIIIDICNSITTPSATNPNASIYINDPGFTSYVIGVDNTVNQCGASTVSTYTYERPTVRFSISANLPSCANLTAPADNAISLPINTTLSWTNGGNATSYDVYFGTNPTSPFIINQTSLTYNTGMLSEFTTYYWKIVARNSNGTANGCTTRTFTTGSACPATYTPPDSTINALTYQNLSWSSVPYTTYYYLYFGTSPDPPFYDSTSNTSYNIVDLLSNTTYYWKIVPKNPTGFGTGCSTISFTTRHTDHWFVKSDGNNTASGNCWNNAVQDLSALLFNVAVGDTVHIAAGTYLPTRDNNNNTSPTDVRTYCFHLIQGVKLLGGYPATANGNNLSTSLSVTRDPYSNLTIMSGNIGPGDSLDNCYHVVWAISGNGGPSLVDGFKITLGYASGTETTDYNGGGIYAINCSLVIQNSILERNYCHSYILGSGHGGAIYSYNCNLTISHCTLTLNGSTIDANAIYAAFGSLELISSTISNHSGYLSTLYVTSATLSIDNCTFWNNNNSTDIQIYNSTNYLLRISNSTISQLVNNGGAQLYLYNSLIYNYIPGIPNNIRNSILNSGSSSTYYDDNGTTTTGLPGMSNWISNLSDNGGHSKTCMLTVYNFQNPAVGKGNPAYAGLTDQRGVVRANPPCVGAVEVPYAIASNILINDTTIYAGSAVTLTAQSSTISSPVFEWYSDLALTTHVFTGSSFTTPVLNSNYFYYITVHNSTVFPNPQPFAKKVTIYVTMLPIITLQPVAIVKCLGDSAGFSVGSYGSGLSYQWVKNSNEITGQTSNILNLNNIQYQDSGYYFCKVTNAYGTTNSNSVQLNVHTVPGTANPITGYSEICPGLNGLQYNTSPITDVNSYTWTFPSGVTGSGNTVSIPVNFSSSAQSGNITVSGSNQCGNGTPSSFSVTVGNYPPSQPGLITGDTIMCQGQTNVAYQITSLPNATSYIWTLPDGASGSSTTNSISVDYELTAVSGNLVVKGSNACGEGASSNSSITVNPILTAGVSISQDQSGVICAGSGVSFTASPVNGGDSPTYQWAKNGNLISGETNSTFTSQTLNNNDAIVCIITSNAACVTGSPAISDTIFTTVTDPLPLTVNIEANPTGPICEGENVHFVANDINGGNSPTYQWILNGIIISGATDSTYNSSTLVNNDLVTCVVTSNAFCISGSPATSDTITVTVSPSLPADVSIVANPGDIVCVGTLVTFTATPVNGGIPTYQWLKNDTVINGETNADYSSALLSNGDIITCIMTSDSGPCLTGSPATSNPVIITIIQPVTASVSISANPTGAICPGTNVTFTATPVNGGSTPLYQWKKNGTNINGATGSTYSSNSLTNGNSITCLLTSNSFCTLGSPATSNPINMIVTSATVASVSISSSPSGAICAGTNVVFTATPVNGGTAPLYQWKKNGININGATLTTYHSTALTNGNIITCMLTSNATPCLTGSPATSNAVYMTVNPVPAAPVISINGIQLHSNSVVGNQWYLNNSAIMAATGQNYTPVTNGDYSDIVTISGCISDTSNIITITDISIEEISDNNSTIIYPNPTENNITIETLLPIKDFLISVYNIQGQMILQQVTQKQITEINTSRFAKGIYILKLNFNDKIEVTRFVKE